MPRVTNRTLLSRRGRPHNPPGPPNGRRANTRTHPTPNRGYPRTHIPETQTPLRPPTRKTVKRANINIATLNMRGATARLNGKKLSLTEKWRTIKDTLFQHKTAILALQETHLDQERLETLRSRYHKNLEILASADPDDPRRTAGVAFVINKMKISPDNIKIHTLVPGRAQMLKIKWLDQCETSIINVYVPTERASQPPFWEKVEKMRRDLRLPRPDFVVGDFNVTEDAIDRAPARLDDVTAVEALRTIRQNWGIQDAWRHALPNEREYTYRATAHEKHIKSRLDRIYAAGNLQNHLFEWHIGNSMVHTDHWLVQVKYAPRDAPHIGKGRWTCPLTLTDDEELLNLIETRGIKLQSDLNDLEVNPRNREESNAQLLWKSFKLDVKKTTKDYAKKSYHKLSARIQKLEKDRKSLTNNPDLDARQDLRRTEAVLAAELERLEKLKGEQQRNELLAKLAAQGEKLGGIWSAMGKEKKPRNPIYRLKTPNATRTIYERQSNRMAELARDYHETLQNDGIPPARDQDEHIEYIRDFLQIIPQNQKIDDQAAQGLNWELKTEQVRQAIKLAKNGTATGMDGCPYELWKNLERRHQAERGEQPPSFDLAKSMAQVFRDIQEFGVDHRTEFTLGWMCPIYKKKDPTEISNYRPITLLNTDYKLLTKVLAPQLMEPAKELVHPDQAGFIPGRLIFDHTRLAKAIINYAELTEENGAIIALNQEKAYDKIMHDYLWETLKTFGLPTPFIKTVRALYENAHTVVAINGILSKPYKVTRGVRQGDPLSCPLFDLAIEPLACSLRLDQRIKGISIPGMINKLVVKLFADDTNLYLSKYDRMDDIQDILDQWCRISGAKFNTEKTEIVPIGSEQHRTHLIETRKLNDDDTHPFPERIRIANEGDAVRVLGAWIGNHIDDVSPWEPIMDKIDSKLKIWEKAHPTLDGKSTIVQAIVGGCTQYLTQVQGMPRHIEKALRTRILSFLWGDEIRPRIAHEHLEKPKEEGGISLLDIRARNEAIDVKWLGTYLNFTPTRPEWAKISDLIIEKLAPQQALRVIHNPFLQNWDVPLQGPNAAKLNDDIRRMLKVAKKYGTNIAAIRVTPHISAQLPAWRHVNAINPPINTKTARCLVTKHSTLTVADLIKTSARIRNPRPEDPHRETQFCRCRDCTQDRENHCLHPHDCAIEARNRINGIAPKLNPTYPLPAHGSLSLTRRRIAQNIQARSRDGAIIFDPTITCKDSISDCFRIFTDPNKISNLPARRFQPQGPDQRHEKITVYTDGACYRNGKADAQCGSGVWFGPNDNRNTAARIPGPVQSNQVGEIAAVIIAADKAPLFQPLEIVTDSQYVINGLTKNLSTWEDNGWTEIKHAALFKKACHLLRKRSATTSLRWVKGHSGIPGNEKSDQLAEDGALKPDVDILDLSIPDDFNIQGAKVTKLTQATAYRGIKQQKTTPTREATTDPLQKTQDAIQEYSGNLETHEAIWLGIRKPAIRIRVRQFLYKIIHNTYMIGQFWAQVPHNSDRQFCSTCGQTESMEHILTQCAAPPRRLIWTLAEQAWPHRTYEWPQISTGLIIGCGTISEPTPTPEEQNVPNPRRTPHKAASRLLQILVTESAHLIWVLRCERVIHDKTHSPDETRTRWRRAINERLTIDKITATKHKRDKTYTKMIKDTWEHLLRKDGAIPDNWLHNCEVLVGSRPSAMF